MILVLLLTSCSALCDHARVSPTDAHAAMLTDTAEIAIRTYQTLEGLFNYYWKPDPLNNKIKFLFVCGQVGGWGQTHAEDQCSCDASKACVNCYRWYDAVALESVANYGIYTGTKNHSEMADVTYDHSPYNGDWGAKCTFIDDFTWYGIAYLRVYEWLQASSFDSISTPCRFLVTPYYFLIPSPCLFCLLCVHVHVQDPKWLERSLSLYKWVWQNGWDESCGGFWWTSCETSKFKDSITIVEALHFSAKLAHMFPNESHYLQDSEKIWNWFFSFDNGYGLMSDAYLVSTGAIPEKCCNSTSSDSYSRCHNTGMSGTSYNQGLLMSSSAYLYLLTGNITYLKVGLRLVDAIIQNYTTSDGILIDEPRSYQSFVGSCWAGADPGGDWYSFNGIFMMHLGYFVDLLSHNGNIPIATLQQIQTLVNKTSSSAWNKSAVWPPFGNNDVCNIGVSPADTSARYPKFHWWWRQKETLQTIPPDPKYFFHRRKLRCVSTNGSKPLWMGKVKKEKNCMEKCKHNTECLIYQFKIAGSALEFKKTNCWLWSFNRSAHACQNNDVNFNIGIKRPVGNATCSGHCNSKEPLNVDHGVCYCDSNCSVHMDCCLDYADHCKALKPLLCQGTCGDLTPRPIPRGGYCWCFDGCNGWFTDNNSDGSCCSDYPQECMHVDMSTCLDARTQGSALNLFLAQLKISSIKIGLGKN